jgi:hypothetical protein
MRVTVTFTQRREDGCHPSTLAPTFKLFNSPELLIISPPLLRATLNLLVHIEGIQSDPRTAAPIALMKKAAIILHKPQFIAHGARLILIWA